MERIGKNLVSTESRSIQFRQLRKYFSTFYQFSIFSTNYHVLRFIASLLSIYFNCQIHDEPETSRAFSNKQYHYSHYYPLNPSSTDSQDRNDIETWGNYDESDYTYDYRRQGKWRRVGQGIDRTFEVIVGAFQSYAVKVSYI